MRTNLVNSTAGLPLHLNINQIQQMPRAAGRAVVRSENSWDRITDVSANAIHLLESTGVLQDFDQRTPVGRIPLCSGMRGHQYTIEGGRRGNALGGTPQWDRTMLRGPQFGIPSINCTPQDSEDIRYYYARFIPQVFRIAYIYETKTVERQVTLVPKRSGRIAIPDAFEANFSDPSDGRGRWKVFPGSHLGASPGALQLSANCSIKWGRVNRRGGRLGSPPSQKSNRNLA